MNMYKYIMNIGMRKPVVYGYKRIFQSIVRDKSAHTDGGNLASMYAHMGQCRGG